MKSDTIDYGCHGSERIYTLLNVLYRIVSSFCSRLQSSFSLAMTVSFSVCKRWG